ncbi:outer membrane protein [Methylobacterium sp. NEAU K]|uniref:outer membrane protein n=1 Tax=Methylobacterium sp. NEAU K TaxID=3064946 RepID=UPI00273687E8|nr:outer membrane beta-barrel protein [Methylobacterium sp. NEAU K]MDP4003879.1 outer membrane beta-barrel protein [Methylobacterium sp. NEAU K]
MRTVTLPLLAVLGLCGVNTARAADLDYDYLRGAEYDPAPAPVIDWSGVYVGGHGGYSSAALGSKGALQPLIYRDSHDTTGEANFNASTLLNPPSKRVGDVSFGAFAGYNVQIDEFVFGVEGDYTYFGRMGVSSDALSLIKTTSGTLETVNLSGSTATRVNDYGTLRARVGYALGNFLPYVTGGVAIGRARVADATSYQNYGFDLNAYNATLAGTSTYITRFGYASFNPNAPYNGTPFTHLQTQSKTKVVAGVAAGAGIEYAITPNILLRAEYQYVLFNGFDGHKVNLNTVRAGAAVKF